MLMKTSIKLINHASVIISDENISILTDPWYSGDAFHKGWNLLHETDDNDIYETLKTITHIWISHEHPDHFSVAFFKRFAKEIKSNSIKILFQKTKDKRVYSFLSSQGFDVFELTFNDGLNLTPEFKVTCIKDGFYDSALFIESHGEKILNLNDCEVTTQKRGEEVYKVTGNVDALLTQFSFAAWKGGKNNKRWRTEAALEKINSMKLQINIFQPKFVIPFASFVYFSNEENFYLNDSVNRPEQLREKLPEYANKIKVMSPNDTLGGRFETLNEDAAQKFWKEKFDKVTNKSLNRYDTISLEDIQDSFHTYCSRIAHNNNMLLIKVLRMLSPIRAFQPVIIRLTDLNCNVEFDYISGNFKKTQKLAMLSMKSASLDFVFNNSFGFDTLTVNGCFEEEKRNGFVDATKTMAIENLNNLGIKIELRTLFNVSVISLFLKRLYRVARKIDS